MHILVVDVHVKPECIDAFAAASMDNAANSLREPGIARFDVLRRQDAPTHFVLVEVYRTANAPARHKETAHYKRWRETVADMMAEPRVGRVFANVYPADPGWDA